MKTRVILVAGAGGVGKTTVSGALALAVPSYLRPALVLTVDPARRLAQALGLDSLSNEPAPIPGRSGVDAAMLDASASWDALVHRHTDQHTADRLVSNRFFRTIAQRFTSGQAYAVAEEMLRLVEAERYRTIIVDTPPIGSGSDFFNSPSEIRTLVAGRALRLLTGAGLPGRKTAYRVATRPALRLADRIVGGPLLEDIGDFLVDLRTTYDGIYERAAQVQGLIDTSDLVAVAAPHPGPIRTVQRICSERPDQVIGTVLNKTVPLEWAEFVPATSTAADRYFAHWSAESAHHRAVARELSGSGLDPALALLTVPEPATISALEHLASSSGLDALVS